MSDLQELLDRLAQTRREVISLMTPAQHIRFAAEERFQTDMLLHGHAISPDGAHHVQGNENYNIYAGGTTCPACGKEDINDLWGGAEHR